MAVSHSSWLLAHKLVVSSPSSHANKPVEKKTDDRSNSNLQTRQTDMPQTEELPDEELCSLQYSRVGERRVKVARAIDSEGFRVQASSESAALGRAEQSSSRRGERE